MRAAMTPRCGVSGQPSAVRDLLTRVQAALSERQALLAGPDTPLVRSRIDALDLRVTELLAQIATIQPPEGTLDDQAAVPGEFDSILGRGHSKQRAD